MKIYDELCHQSVYLKIIGLTNLPNVGLFLLKNKFPTSPSHQKVSLVVVKSGINELFQV